MSIAFQLPTLHHEAPTFTQIDDEDDDDDGQEEAQVRVEASPCHAAPER